MPEPNGPPKSDQRLLLGVDGGGSKTVSWLAQQHSPSSFAVLGRGRAGPSNPRTVGELAAHQAIIQSIDLAFADARQPKQPATVAILAIAGTAEPISALPLFNALTRSKIAKRIEIVPDAAPLLTAGTTDPFGIALVAGTGSVAFGKNTKGESATAGGFGFLFGDEGSGFWLGQQALIAAAASIDNRRPKSPLTSAILDQLNSVNARQLKDAIYGADDSRHRIADLAPTVFQAANQRDPAAVALIETAAAELASLVDTVAGQIGYRHQTFRLVLSGSLLTQTDQLSKQVVQRLVSIGCHPDPISIIADPVVGCLQLALV